jgi:hypothetical protein
LFVYKLGGGFRGETKYGTNGKGGYKMGVGKGGRSSAVIQHGFRVGDRDKGEFGRSLLKFMYLKNLNNNKILGETLNLKLKFFF